MQGIGSSELAGASSGIAEMYMHTFLVFQKCIIRGGGIVIMIDNGMEAEGAHGIK